MLANKDFAIFSESRKKKLKVWFLREYFSMLNGCFYGSVLVVAVQPKRAAGKDKDGVLNACFWVNVLVGQSHFTEQENKGYDAGE
jgi:hypothetical protein